MAESTILNAVSPLGVIKEDLLDQCVSGNKQIGPGLCQEGSVRAASPSFIHENLRNSKSLFCKGLRTFNI